MFNLFNKIENTDQKITKYSLSEIGDVQYFPRLDRKTQEKTIASWGTYNGLKLKFRTGVFVDTYNDETIVEPVIRVQVVDKFEPKKENKYKPTGKPVGRPLKNKKEVKHNNYSKYNDICKLLKKNVKPREIAEKLDVTRSYVYAVKKEVDNVYIN